MRFWIVGCEKPKKSAPDGTMGATDLELRKGHKVKFTRTSEDIHLGLIVARRQSTGKPKPSLCGELVYLTDAMAFSRLPWHIRAEEATMAF